MKYLTPIWTSLAKNDWELANTWYTEGDLAMFYHPMAVAKIEGILEDNKPSEFIKNQIL